MLNILLRKGIPIGGVFILVSFLASWLFGFLAFWLLGFLAFQLLGFLASWLLGFRLFGGFCGFWWLFLA